MAAELRHATWAALAAGGLDSIPVNTFSYYDQVLDTAVLLGALPASRRGDRGRSRPLFRGGAWQRRRSLPWR